MKIINNTSHEDSSVEKIAAWVSEDLGVSPDTIEIVEREDVVGYGGSFRSWDNRVLALIAPADYFPKDHDRGLPGGPPVIHVDNWQTALVGILAHEITHAKQRLCGKDFCEVEAEWAEYLLIDRWRSCL